MKKLKMFSVVAGILICQQYPLCLRLKGNPHIECFNLDIINGGKL